MELTTDFAGMSRSATNAEATVSSTTAAHTSYALSKVFDQDKGTGGDNRWLPFQSALPNVNLTFTFAHPFRVTSYKIKGQNNTYTINAVQRHGCYMVQMMERVGRSWMI